MNSESSGAQREDDVVITYADARFEIRPYPTYADLLKINAFVNELGYKLPFSMKQFSMEDVQAKLRAEGPRAFLKVVRIQEDLSPKAPLATARQLVADRLARPAPAEELVIVDPYLFPSAPRLGVVKYGEFLAELISPLLASRATVKCVVNSRSSSVVEEAARAHLLKLNSEAVMVVHQTEDFHDRFWLADRTRGVVVGASLNGLGDRIFFLDDLARSDLKFLDDALRRLEV